MIKIIEDYNSDNDQRKTAPTQFNDITRQYFVPGIKNQYFPNTSNVSTNPSTDSDSLDLLVIDDKAQGMDISDVITDDKLKLLGATSRLLKSQIMGRSKIRDDNINRLDYVIIQCESYMLQLDETWPPFLNPMADSKRADLSHTVTKLESEKNQEVVKCWNDLVRLYSELIKTLGEYQQLVRRTQLLSGDLR